MAMQINNLENFSITEIERGIDTSDANAISADCLNGKTFYAGGEKITGTGGIKLKTRASAQSGDCSISCAIGDLIVVWVAKRDALTVPNGWTLVHTDDGISAAQWGSFLYKIAAETTESISIATGNTGRIYTMMAAFSGATQVNFIEHSVDSQSALYRTRGNTVFTLYGCHQYLTNSEFYLISNTGLVGIACHLIQTSDSSNDRACLCIVGDPVIDAEILLQKGSIANEWGIMKVTLT